MPQAQSNENQRWWSDFHHTFGMDGEEEAAFHGYLVTRGLAALEMTPEQLDAAYSQFVAWWQGSR